MIKNLLIFVILSSVGLKKTKTFSMARGRISIDDGKCNELLFFAQFFSSVETSQKLIRRGERKKKKERKKGTIREASVITMIERCLLISWREKESEREERRERKRRKNKRRNKLGWNQHQPLISFMANKHYDTLQINEQRCFEPDIWNDTRHRLPICIGLEMQTDGGKSQFRARIAISLR